MVSKTTNAYGDITITDKAIASVTCACAEECYGVVKLVNRDIFESIRELLNKSYRFARGVKVRANQNRIVIDIYVIFKYGVSIEAVARSLKDTVKYNVEDFTGMIVDSVNVHVVGIHV